MSYLSWILAFTIIVGQTVKIPLLNLGVTVLDIVVIFLCLLGLLKLKQTLKKPPIWVLTASIFIFIALLSLALSPLNLDAVQNLASLAYLIRFADFILLGWLIYSGVFPEIKKNISTILILSGVGLAILGLLQLIFLSDLRFLASSGWDPHYFRVVSTFLDPNFVGAFFVLTLLVLFQNRAIAQKWYKLLFVLSYTSLLATFSRGAYLMFIASFAILTILNKSVKLAIFTIILSLGLFLGFTIYSQVVAAPRNIDRVQSAEYRLDSWQQGVKMFLDHPILGVGYNSYRYALRQYNLADEQFLASRGASSNDSSFLFVAATTGVLGLTSYLLFLGSILWSGFKSKNYILVAGLTGLIAQSFFANTLFYPFLLLWIILVAASNSVSEKPK